MIAGHPGRITLKDLQLVAKQAVGFFACILGNITRGEDKVRLAMVPENLSNHGIQAVPRIDTQQPTRRIGHQVRVSQL